MNSSAPSCLTNSLFRPDPVPITYAPLFFASCTAIEKSLPRSQRCDWHRRRSIEVNLVRVTHELARRRRHILCATATMRVEITINLIAGYKIAAARPARTYRLHSPCDLAAKNQRRLQAEEFAQSVADFPIDRIYRCRPHFHQQLISSRRGPSHFRECRHLFISITLDPHCFHDFLLLLFRLNLPSSTRLQFR